MNIKWSQHTTKHQTPVLLVMFLCQDDFVNQQHMVHEFIERCNHYNYIDWGLWPHQNHAGFQVILPEHDVDPAVLVISQLC